MNFMILWFLFNTQSWMLPIWLSVVSVHARVLSKFCQKEKQEQAKSGYPLLHCCQYNESINCSLSAPWLIDDDDWMDQWIYNMFQDSAPPSGVINHLQSASFVQGSMPCGSFSLALVWFMLIRFQPLTAFTSLLCYSDLWPLSRGHCCHLAARLRHLNPAGGKPDTCSKHVTHVSPTPPFRGPSSRYAKRCRWPRCRAPALMQMSSDLSQSVDIRE